MRINGRTRELQLLLGAATGSLKRSRPVMVSTSSEEGDDRRVFWVTAALIAAW